jgi:hypothetical protein
VGAPALSGRPAPGAERPPPAGAPRNIVLRRAAALALASRRENGPFGYIAARPELRARVRTVLEECAFLRPDHADLHFTLAKLYELDERPDAARISMARYKLLRPWEK